MSTGALENICQQKSGRAIASPSAVPVFLTMFMFVSFASVRFFWSGRIIRIRGVFAGRFSSNKFGSGWFSRRNKGLRNFRGFTTIS